MTRRYDLFPARRRVVPPGRLLAFSAAVLLAISPCAEAQTWSGAGLTGSWSDLFNWTGFQRPVSSAATAITFEGSRQLNTTQNISSPFNLNSLSFASGAGAFSISGNALRFVGSDAKLVQNSASTMVLGSAVQIADRLSVQGSGSVSFKGGLSGSASAVLVRQGTGRLTLAAPSSFAGRVEVQGGVLQLDDALALQSAHLVLGASGALDLNNVSTAKVGLLTSSGAGTLNLGATQLTIGGSSAADQIYVGSISATSGSLTKAGTGTARARFNTGSAIDGLFINQDGMVLDGGELSVKNASEGLRVGQGSIASPVATLAVTGGSSLVARGTTVQVDGGVGTSLEVVGTGSRLHTGFQALVGNHANGAMRVASGGTVAADTYLLVGWDSGGAGQLSVEAGGNVTSASGVIGGLSNASGGATVIGQGARWSTGALSLGGISDGLQGGTGVLDVGPDGEVVVSSGLSFWTAASRLSIDRGRLSAGWLSGNVGQVVLQSDGASGAALVLNANGIATSFSGSVSGAGSLLKMGTGTQVLAGVNSFTGSVQVQGGTLVMANGAASDYQVSNDALLKLGQSSLGSAVVQVDAGTGRAQYTASTLSGGTLMGGGTHDISAVRRMVGTRLANGATLTPSTGTTFLGVISDGIVHNAVGRSLTWTGGSNPAGRLIVQGTTSVSGFTSGGIIEVSPGARLDNRQTDLILLAGSRTVIGSPEAPGGILDIGPSNRLMLNGGLLVNNGTVQGIVVVNYGGLAKGAGTYGPVIVGDGGRFSPGNSPGRVDTGEATWAPGGGYLVELAAAAGVAGSAWDLWSIAGGLNITAGNTVNSRFKVQLASLDAAGGSAPLAGFDPHHAWQWLIVDTTTGITGFDPSRVELDTHGFVGDTAGGHFSLQVADGDLYLNFAPVPEPGAWALMLSGLLALNRLQARRGRRGG